MDKTFSFGGEASREDYRTVVADQATGVQLPEKSKVALDFPQVDDLCDQKHLGICTKCACRMAEELYHKDGVRLSEYWGYLMGKVLIDDPFYNGMHFQGSSAFTMLKTAYKWGTPTKAMEQQFPLLINGTYNEFWADFQTRYGGKIPQAILDNAALHKIPGYYQVKIDPASIAKEISEGRLIVIRMAVGENFYKDVNGNITWDKNLLLPLRIPKAVDAGHLMAMNEYVGLGYDQLDKGPNSWSKAWADNGYYSFVFQVQAPYYFTEAWAIGNLPPEVIQNVNDLPEAKNFTHRFEAFIERGQTGSEVRALQIALSILGFLVIHVDELGTYGPKTAKAVLAYQKARKLLPDPQLEANGGNYVHRLTLNALNKDISK